MGRKDVFSVLERVPRADAEANDLTTSEVVLSPRFLMGALDGPSRLTTVRPRASKQ